MEGYMNAFTPYADGRPIENNVSRVLAIALNGNPQLLDRLIDIININLVQLGEKPAEKPASPDDFTIDIQRHASELAQELEAIQRIIPVTLTPNEAMKESDSYGNDDPIPDICITCENGETSDMIIIEVKIKSDVAEAQSRHQAENIASRNETGSEVTICPVIKLAWKDIVKLLLDVSALQRGNDLILAHYIEYLKRNYTGWFPASPFSAKMTDEFVQARLDLLANSCAEKLTLLYAPETFSAGSSFTYTGRKITFSPSWGYMREFHILANFGNDSRLTGISVCFWPGNNAGQSWYLFGGNTSDNLSWTQRDSINAWGENLVLSVEPHLKFSHYRGKYIMAACASHDAIGTDKAEIRKKFCAPLNGRWKKEGEYKYTWEDLKSRLLDGIPAEEIPAILCGESAEAFRNDFAEKFEASGKNYVYISLGYEISIEIPVSKLAQLDKDFSHRTEKQDNVADFIVSIVKAVREMIEK